MRPERLKNRGFRPLGPAVSANLLRRVDIWCGFCVGLNVRNAGITFSCFQRSVRSLCIINRIFAPFLPVIKVFSASFTTNVKNYVCLCAAELRFPQGKIINLRPESWSSQHDGEKNRNLKWHNKAREKWTAWSKNKANSPKMMKIQT